ncbi:MAG: ribonuclease E activity regulator RraA [Ideonella sp.]|nr:ribonuclease E activity regulator RraA [Ideonella sp.]MCC7457936.1 ribonuclease E activity regulator RraA [Nitrospira sp.]
MNSLSTCDLCDAHKTEPSARFRVLPPLFRDYGGRARFHGAVATVQCLEDNTSVRELVYTPGQGRVLVVDGGGSLRRALVGGNLAQLAERNGWAGVIVYGAVRDVDELRKLQIGVRALATMPLPTEKRHAGVVGQPVQIDGVWVSPGEWLVADEDGIVLLAEKPA